MSGERDIESLSVVTYEKAKFRAPSNRRSRFESGLQPNLISVWSLYRKNRIPYCML